MRKLQTFAALALVAIALTACQTGKESAAFKTISAIQTGSTTTLNAFYALVIKGTIPTNGVPAVSGAYNHLQGSITEAVIASSGNTNAPAPVSLVAESALFGLTVANASTIKK